jgi:sugar/nucleoside kinase (ribokinase family)
MTRESGIISAGNWVIDFVKILDAWPTEGNLANVLDIQKGTGGAPFNVLIALAKLKTGIPLQGVGIIGRDAEGVFVLRHCQSFGIDTSQMIQSDTAGTSYTDVMTVQSTGNRTFFHYRGANALLSNEHFHWEHLHGKILHLGYLLLLDKLDAPDREYGTKSARLFRDAQQAGLITSLDIVSEMSDRYKTLVPPALKYTDYLFINELEAGRTTGHLIRRGNHLDELGLYASAQALLNMGVRKAVILHFPEGAYWFSAKGEKFYQKSLSLPESYIKGTVGAGDAFCAGVLCGIHENWDPVKSLKLGVCTAATCLSEANSTHGLRSLDETLALYNQYPPGL